MALIEPIIILPLNTIFHLLENGYVYLIYDCIPCQTQKSSRMDINTATQIPFASTANNFNHRISMDTKGPIFPKSKDNNYIFVICDAFSHFVITQPTPLNDAETATEVLLKNGLFLLAHLKFL